MKPKPQDHESLASTDQRAAFCKEYLVDRNSTQAAIRAGYARHSAHCQASKMLKDPDIQAELRRLEANRQDDRDAIARLLRDELNRIAFANIGDVVTVSGGTMSIRDFDDLDPDVISAIEQVSTRDGEIVVKLSNKLNAIKLRGQIDGLFIERSEVKQDVSVGGITEESRAKIRELVGIREVKDA